MPLECPPPLSWSIVESSGDSFRKQSQIIVRIQNGFKLIKDPGSAPSGTSEEIGDARVAAHDLRVLVHDVGHGGEVCNQNIAQ